MVGTYVPELVQEVYVTMAIQVSTEVITDQLLAEIADLYAAEKYKQALWKWQFCSRFGRDSQCIVARDGERVVGFNATMPISLMDGSGKSLDAIWSCDFIVAPDYRGQGVGQAIKDEMARSFSMPIMSLGISDSAFPLLLKKGWHSPAKLDVWDLIIQPKTLKQFVLFFWAKVCRLYLSATTKLSKQKYIVNELGFLPQQTVVEHLWKLHRAQSTDVEIRRDYAYLKWRYTECPFNVYRFLHIGSAVQGALALVVFRITPGNSLEIIDFIGVKNTSSVSAVCSYLLKNYPVISAVHWNTSIASLRSGLIANGFVKKSYGSRFATLSPYTQQQWGLVAGDSDGDFLRVAKEAFTSNSSVAGLQQPGSTAILAINLVGRPVYSCPEGFIYRQLSEQEFQSLEPTWTLLVNKSDANPLFMGWQWMMAWWSQWGRHLKLELNLILIFDKDSLVGILPLYRVKKNLMMQYQFIGNAWALAPTVRSEYITPIFDRQKAALLYRSLACFILTRAPNSTFLFPDTTGNPIAGVKFWQHRIDAGYKVDVTGSFNNYVDSLGRMTRLKAFNRRAYLLEHYSAVEFVALDQSAKQLEEFFTNLNSFHLLRWGKPCFSPRAVEFHKQLLSSKNIKGLLSYLTVNNRIVSASYNIQVADVIYNIQSGYLEEFDKMISLGTLQMGWIIESAFGSPDVNYFDFLAGFGRAEDYKRHYRGTAVDFFTRQYFSSSIVAAAHISYFVMKSRLRKLIVKLRQFIGGHREL